METQQEMKIRMEIIEAISNCEFWQGDHNFGYMPDRIDELMADAAMNVLKVVRGTNQYFTDNPQ